MLHSGDLQEAIARFGGSREDWLDLSQAINPRPYPLPPLPRHAWTHLPDAREVQRLELLAAASFGTISPSCLVAAPGRQALVQILCWLRPAGRVLVVSPTFEEHAACWEGAGHVLQHSTQLPPPDATGLPPVVLVTNPNNPDGRLFPRRALIALAEVLATRGGLLLVDEAFADAAPAESLVAEAGRPGLAVLRSFGNTYGLAGVRLGFLLADPMLIEQCRERLGPWALSGPAIAAGTVAFQDGAWLTGMRQWLVHQSGELAGVLRHAGLKIRGQTPLFALAEADDAAKLQSALARSLIWARTFPNEPRWLRFGLPADDAELARLEAALAFVD